jgi:thiol-disulfide isomerase/thioredoxin
MKDAICDQKQNRSKPSHVGNESATAGRTRRRIGFRRRGEKCEYRRHHENVLLIDTDLALTSMAFGAKEGWLDDLEKAKTQAKAENKKILLDFTGSDWCGWCKKLDKEVFSQQAWKEYAAKHLVLVEVDFPHVPTPSGDKKAERPVGEKIRDSRLSDDRHHHSHRNETR